MPALSTELEVQDTVRLTRNPDWPGVLDLAVRKLRIELLTVWSRKDAVADLLTPNPINAQRTDSLTTSVLRKRLSIVSRTPLSERMTLV